MKKIIFIFILLPFFGFSQQIAQSFIHNGITRNYLIHVPAIYNGSTPVPIVIALHGLGDDMNNFAGIGMNYVADTANFIVVTPQAILEPLFTNSTAWNSGAGYLGYSLNANINDVGFISELIDTIAAHYNVNLQRVYACGFSMGGFMSQRLACELNDKIAAVASVAGTIGSTLTCNPGRAVPVCHFHGTGDATIPYSGNQYGMDVPTMMSFWEANNGCSSGAVNTALPNLFADGYTVQHSLYSSCTNNAEIELFRVDSADHVWLGPTNDIFYTHEIWKFFNKHINTVAVNEITTINDFELFPNPAVETSSLLIKTTEAYTAKIYIVDITGKQVNSETHKLSIGNNTIGLNLTDLNAGIYFITVDSENFRLTKKLVVRK